MNYHQQRLFFLTPSAEKLEHLEAGVAVGVFVDAVDAAAAVGVAAAAAAAVFASASLVVVVVVL